VIDAPRPRERFGIVIAKDVVVPTRLALATNTVHLGESHILLPIVPPR